MSDAAPSTPTGTYTLLVELDTPATVEVGALGPTRFDPGWYAYVGSALGPGGLDRVDRHWETATGAHDVRHWHVDYLLGETAARVVAATVTRDRDVECRVANGLDGDRNPGFGASDCDCDGHLLRYEHRDAAIADVEAAHADA